MVEKRILEVVDLVVEVNSKRVLNGISLRFVLGEVVVLLGPNGAGKSTLANVLMGNPAYKIVSGKVLLDGKDITNLGVEKRAKMGLFMSFQHPVEIEGVTMLNFLRSSYNSVKGTCLPVSDFLKVLNSKMELLGMDSKFRSRFVNLGFSGGEKKRAEVLQLLLLEPDFAILDEIDSGLDVDALRVVGEGIKRARLEKELGLIVITHYNKILDYLKPDKVFILNSGRIVCEGGAELIRKVELEGFGKN